MSFTFKLDEDAASSVGTGGVLNTGVHLVKITDAFLTQTKNGDNTIDLELEAVEGGAKASIYGMCIEKTWKSGSENYDYPRWQELASVIGMTTGATTDVTRTLYSGAKEPAKSFDELKNQQVMIAIQLQFSEYNGDESKKRKITRTFYADGKSIAEKKAGKEATQSISYAKDIKDYFDKGWKKAFGNGRQPAGETIDKEEVTSDDAADLLG